VFKLAAPADAPPANPAARRPKRVRIASGASDEEVAMTVEATTEGTKAMDAEDEKAKDDNEQQQAGADGAQPMEEAEVPGEGGGSPAVREKGRASGGEKAEAKAAAPPQSSSQKMRIKRTESEAGVEAGRDTLLSMGYDGGQISRYLKAFPDSFAEGRTMSLSLSRAVDWLVSNPPGIDNDNEKHEGDDNDHDDSKDIVIVEGVEEEQPKKMTEKPRKQKKAKPTPTPSEPSPSAAAPALRRSKRTRRPTKRVTMAPELVEIVDEAPKSRKKRGGEKKKKESKGAGPAAARKRRKPRKSALKPGKAEVGAAAMLEEEDGGAEVGHDDRKWVRIFVKILPRRDDIGLDELGWGKGATKYAGQPYSQDFVREHTKRSWGGIFKAEVVGLEEEARDGMSQIHREWHPGLTDIVLWYVGDAEEWSLLDRVALYIDLQRLEEQNRKNPYSQHEVEYLCNLIHDNGPKFPQTAQEFRKYKQAVPPRFGLSLHSKKKPIKPLSMRGASEIPAMIQRQPSMMWDQSSEVKDLEEGLSVIFKTKLHYYQKRTIMWAQSLEEEVRAQMRYKMPITHIKPQGGQHAPIVFPWKGTKLALEDDESVDTHLSFQGGVIANEMGLGKTLTTIALILLDKDPPFFSSKGKKSKKSRKTARGGDDDDDEDYMDDNDGDNKDDDDDEWDAKEHSGKKRRRGRGKTAPKPKKKKAAKGKTKAAKGKKRAKNTAKLKVDGSPNPLVNGEYKEKDTGSRSMTARKHYVRTDAKSPTGEVHLVFFSLYKEWVFTTDVDEANKHPDNCLASCNSMVKVPEDLSGRQFKTFITESPETTAKRAKKWEPWELNPLEPRRTIHYAELNIKIISAGAKLELKDGRIQTDATLVVCPSHLAKQWKEEAEKHISPHCTPRPSVYVVTTMPQLNSLSRQLIKEADIVVVSVQLFMNTNYMSYTGLFRGASSEFRNRQYDMLAKNQTRTAIEAFHWKRFIVDEAHELLSPTILGKDPIVIDVVMCIKASTRWYLSGTPFTDTYLTPRAAMRFIRVKINDEEVFEKELEISQLRDRSLMRIELRKAEEAPGAKTEGFLAETFPQRKAMIMLSGVGAFLDRMLFSRLYCRYTKQFVEGAYDLPDYETEIVRLEMHPIERAFYEIASESRVPSFQERLRELCAHPCVSRADRQNFGAAVCSTASRFGRSRYAPPTISFPPLPSCLQSACHNYISALKNRSHRLARWQSDLRKIARALATGDFTFSPVVHVREGLDPRRVLPKRAMKAALEIRKALEAQHEEEGVCSKLIVLQKAYNPNDTTYEYTKLWRVLRVKAIFEDRMHAYLQYPEFYRLFDLEKKLRKEGGYTWEQSLRDDSITEQLKARLSDMRTRNAIIDYPTPHGSNSNRVGLLGAMASGGGGGYGGFSIGFGFGRDDEEEAARPANLPSPSQYDYKEVHDPIIPKTYNVARDETDDAANHLTVEAVSKHGSKIAYIMSRVKNMVLDPNARIILFSQWGRFFEGLKSAMDENDIKYVLVKGNVHMRTGAIKKFNTDPHVKVIMLSLTQSASGANLQRASHVILLDPVAGTKEEAEAVEAQAIGRAHRQGQDKELTVVRIVMSRTIEEQLLERQDEAADWAE